MNTSFPYDAAISFVAEDALTARHLIGRLRDRLGAPTFEPANVHPESMGDEGGEIPPAVLNGSRVVIVLHQRLWGETPSTRQDRGAIERRAAQEGMGFSLSWHWNPTPSCRPASRRASHACASRRTAPMKWTPSPRRFGARAGTPDRFSPQAME